MSGITFLISGIRYKERLNRKVLKGDERAAYARSSYFITTMTGAVILFTGLGGGYLANYMNAKPMIVWFLIIAFVGGLLIVVGRFLKKDTYGT
jgi:F0F1-type ATP synthase assembly protein I